MKILHFTTLFPNSREPRHGLFVARRLQHLLASGQVEAKVVAPVPWFPSTHPMFGRYATLAAVPELETMNGLSILHPRYPLLPKVGMSLAPFSMAWSVRPVIARLIREGYDFQLVDAHYFYPDGVAAAWLGHWFQKPVVITARGTDINFIPRYPLPRRMILWAAKQAAGLIANCQALKEEMTALGIPGEKIRVLRNGVDLDFFTPPVDRPALRLQEGFSAPTLLSVGHMIPRKGHDLVLSMLPQLPGIHALLVGEGPETGRLQALAHHLGVSDRVSFTGAVSPERLVSLYGAADLLVLASDREGWANVLLEAMACGTPVVATPVWGTPEVVAAPQAGRLAEERTPQALAKAVATLLASLPDRAATRCYAEGFSWEETTRGQLRLFTEILEQRT